MSGELSSGLCLMLERKRDRERDLVVVGKFVGAVQINDSKGGCWSNRKEMIEGWRRIAA
jgi:hypothetical protein